MKIEPISVERKYSGDIVMIADIVRGRIFKRRERVTFFGRMIENGSCACGRLARSRSRISCDFCGLRVLS